MDFERIRKTVIPVAGWGTRFLPVTKAVPKVMLPVVDKPAVHYVVEEASRAGIDDVLLVTGRGQESIEDYFGRTAELEEVLERKGDKTRLGSVRYPAELATVHTTRQSEQKGLGHAVLCAQRHVGDEPFVVQLGDDLIDPRDQLLPAMATAHARYGGVIIALLEVPQEHVNRYGIATVSPSSDTAGGYDVVGVSGLVEKPAAADAPSKLAVIGRYVLPPEIFEALQVTKPGAGGEIQLTDGMAQLLADGMPIHGVVFTGRRYDTGDKGDYLKAVVRLAWDREDVGPEFRSWLTEFMHGNLKQ